MVHQPKINHQSLPARQTRMTTQGHQSLVVGALYGDDPLLLARTGRQIWTWFQSMEKMRTITT